MKKIIVAIDGYSSCGKSTMAKDLARAVGYIYVDTGAMYRAVTLYALRNNLFEADGSVKAAALENQMENAIVSFRLDPSTNLPQTYLNDECVEKEIRSLEVSSHVSPVAALPFVREALTCQQQAMGSKRGIVMDGRDIGTVVFPDAELKIFVTASAEVRAQRRFDELQAKGMPADFEDILRNVKERDYIDSHRDVAPLRQAEDAVVLDNSEMTVSQQREWLLAKFEDAVERKEQRVGMLNIEIDEHSGFCFGVTTAIGKAEEELAHSQRLYCLGDIVHNGSECERLRGMGLETIDHEAFRSLRQCQSALRAHGEPPETYATALANGINIIDATCPVVLQIATANQAGVFGARAPANRYLRKARPWEVLGLVGQTDGTAIVIEGLRARRSSTSHATSVFSLRPPNRWRGSARLWTISRHTFRRLPHSVPTTPSADRWPIACRISALLPCATMSSSSSCVASKSSNGRVLFEALPSRQSPCLSRRHAGGAPSGMVRWRGQCRRLRRHFHAEMVDGRLPRGDTQDCWAVSNC